MITHCDAVNIFTVSVLGFFFFPSPQSVYNTQLSVYWFQIQGTNDFNTVSKCSMAKNGYFRDDFISHFVTKCSRRTPLIHLGYYMRVLTVDFTLRSFLDAMSGQPTQVLHHEKLQSTVCLFLSCSYSRSFMKYRIYFEFHFRKIFRSLTPTKN